LNAAEQRKKMAGSKGNSIQFQDM